MATSLSDYKKVRKWRGKRSCVCRLWTWWCECIWEGKSHWPIHLGHNDLCKVTTQVQLLSPRLISSKIGCSKAKCRKVELLFYAWEKNPVAMSFKELILGYFTSQRGVWGGYFISLNHMHLRKAGSVLGALILWKCFCNGASGPDPQLQQIRER